MFVDAEGPLDLLDPDLGRHDDPLLLVDLVVDVARKCPGDSCELVVELRGVVGRARR